jgi:hypothetical protein
LPKITPRICTIRYQCAHSVSNEPNENPSPIAIRTGSARPLSRPTVRRLEARVLVVTASQRVQVFGARCFVDAEQDPLNREREVVEVGARCSAPRERRVRKSRERLLAIGAHEGENFGRNFAR